MAKTITVTPQESQDHALKWSIPLVIVLGAPYFLFYWEQFLPLQTFTLIKGLLILLSLIVFGTVIHELLHGLTWALFTRKKWRAIHFGIFWQALMPYCHCQEALRLIPYQTGLAMPGLLLGIAPLIAGYVSGKPLVFLFGLYFTYSAISDFRIMWKLCGEPSSHWIQDHPEQIGCLVYSPEEMQQKENHE